MLHRADAAWSPGRSEALRKLTPWLDAEARVVAHVPGKGRLAGSVARCWLNRSMAGAFASVPGSAMRHGATATDRCHGHLPLSELTGQGLPRFPRFLRERVLP